MPIRLRRSYRGNPPKDDSYNFAVIAIVLLVVAWIVIPAGLWVVITKQR